MEGSSESQSLKLKPQSFMARNYSEPATFNEKTKSVSKEKCGQSGIGLASMIFHCKMSRGGKVCPTSLELRLQGRGAHAGGLGRRAGAKEVVVPTTNAGSKSRSRSRRSCNYC